MYKRYFRIYSKFTLLFTNFKVYILIAAMIIKYFFYISVYKTHNALYIAIPRTTHETQTQYILQI